MRIFSLLALSVITVGVHISSAQAECYGDAADAYGCGVPAQRPTGKSPRNAPSLERFGSDNDPVLPDTGYYQNQNATDVITPEERHRMMRGIVLGRGGSTRSRSVLTQAINSAGRPVRRSGAMPARTR
jgi:hypothetical protein